MKTPDQVLQTVDGKRKEILERAVAAIEKYIDDNFSGNPLEYTTYDVTPSEAKLVIDSLKTYMRDYNWDIVILRAETTCRASYVTFQITPINKIKSSAEDYYNK